MSTMQLYRAPFSTHSERVSLALAHKGIEVESHYIDYQDRREVERVSGQGLVPVLVDGETVVADSMEILAYLDRVAPSPPLYPEEGTRRAEMLAFIEWFDDVWKPLADRIEAEVGCGAADRARLASLGGEIAAALDRFEALLSDRDHLFGDDFSAADCAAFPFLKYALRRDPADTELFHQVLDEYQPLQDRHERLRAWIERVDEYPRV
jgi:glutathione S-transferase